MRDVSKTPTKTGEVAMAIVEAVRRVQATRRADAQAVGDLIHAIVTMVEECLSAEHDGACPQGACRHSVAPAATASDHTPRRGSRLATPSSVRSLSTSRRVGLTRRTRTPARGTRRTSLSEPHQTDGQGVQLSLFASDTTEPREAVGTAALRPVAQ